MSFDPAEFRAAVQLTRSTIDFAAVLQAVATSDAGGIDMFIGVTRAEDAPASAPGAPSGPLVRLDYEAYEEMALNHMRLLANRARLRWPILRAAIWHRLGPVAVGEASVIIAVSARHRAEAFDACRYIIDELKKDIPIWKKEIYESHTRWQGEANGPNS